MGVVPGDKLSPLHSIPGLLPSLSSPAPTPVAPQRDTAGGELSFKTGTLKKTNTKWSQKRANRYQGTLHTSRAGASSFHGRGGGAAWEGLSNAPHGLKLQALHSPPSASAFMSISKYAVPGGQLSYSA